MFIPYYRPRRLRRNQQIRNLVRETTLTRHDLILPLFVTAEKNVKKPISSMAGHAQLSLNYLAEEAKAVWDMGIEAVILFGIPEHKDAIGSDVMSDDGIIARALHTVKEAAPDLYVITDVCFCEYTDHGHCGPLKDGDVDNDATLTNLQKQVIVQARHGADMVAPSGMMDGMIGVIREALDDEGFSHIPIMSYAVKYASGFYGPFREAAESTPKFGNRATYQMDPANSNEALREVAFDVDEGADVVMVKPAMPYLDIIRQVKDQFGLPTAAYQVSGEFAMIKAAAERGWIDHDRVMLETLTSIKRAGADMILTYFAKEAVGKL